jgi:hypothetical protein
MAIMMGKDIFHGKKERIEKLSRLDDGTLVIVSRIRFLVFESIGLGGSVNENWHYVAIVRKLK